MMLSLLGFFVLLSTGIAAPISSSHDDYGKVDVEPLLQSWLEGRQTAENDTKCALSSLVRRAVEDNLANSEDKVAFAVTQIRDELRITNANLSNLLQHMVESEFPVHVFAGISLSIAAILVAFLAYCSMLASAMGLAGSLMISKTEIDEHRKRSIGKHRLGKRITRQLKPSSDKSKRKYEQLSSRPKDKEHRRTSSESGDSDSSDVERRRRSSDDGPIKQRRSSDDGPIKKRRSSDDDKKRRSSDEPKKTRRSSADDDKQNRTSVRSTAAPPPSQATPKKKDEEGDTKKKQKKKKSKKDG